MRRFGAYRPVRGPASIALALLVAAAPGCASWPGWQADAHAPATADADPDGAAQAAVYTVRPGDTLSAIARAHGATVAELAAWNGIADPDRIQTGAVLRVSAEARASESPPAPHAPEEVTVVAPSAQPAPEKVAVVAPSAEPVKKEVAVVAPSAKPAPEAVIALSAKSAPEEVAVIAPSAQPAPEEVAVVAPSAPISDRDRFAHARADLVDAELRFQAARYEDSLEAAERARALLAERRDAEARAVRARAALLSGMALGALDDEDGALARFREALTDDPAIALPAPAPPKLARLFDAARADAREAQGP